MSKHIEQEVHGEPCTVVKKNGKVCGKFPSIWYMGKQRFCRAHKKEAYASVKHSPKDAYTTAQDSTQEPETELVEI